MIFLKGYILTTSHAQQSFCKKYKYQTQLNPMESNLKNPKNYCKSFNQQGLQYPNKDLLESKKSRFLESLKGKSLAYKRYAKSPLRYGGGKSLAVGLILEHFPNDLCRVISPFIGGGSVEVAAALELGLEVKAFDIFDILVNFWQVLLRDSKALYESLLVLKPNKETYAKIKEEVETERQENE